MTIYHFITDYCETILKNRSEIKEVVNCHTQAVIKFVPQNIAVVLENIYSNSQKAHANTITFNLHEDDEYFLIDVLDNGIDNKWRGVNDINQLFEFGKSFTLSGSGVGLYHIKEIIEGMNGDVSINLNNQTGFEINMRIKK